MLQSSISSLASEKLSQVNSIIGQQLYILPHEDKQKAYFDLHAVPRDIKESPNLIQTSLKLMKKRVSEISQKNDAYDIAKKMDHNYVNNPELRLMFLRGQQFDYSLAAETFIRFFALKLELFDKSKLVKDIVQDDLQPSDVAALYSGHIQRLPMKDTASRNILISFPGKKAKSVSLISKLRVAFYLQMVALEDIEVQRRGTVIIVSPSDIKGRKTLVDLQDHQYLNKVAELINALPGRVQGLHIISFQSHRLLDTISWNIFSSLIYYLIAALMPGLQVRVRLHHVDSEVGCYSELSGFGFPIHLIPKSPKDKENYVRALEQRKRLEKQRLDQLAPHYSDSICVPCPFDVILGRGRTRMDHQGNLILRGLVEAYSDKYEAASRNKKKTVAIEVLDIIKQSGRFIKEEDVGWVEIPDEVARLKVSHVFRDLRKESKKKETSVAENFDFWTDGKEF